jgi:sortase system peptidoglycan-associated protein
MLKKLSLVLLVSVAATAVHADTKRANYENPASAEETSGFFSGAILGGLAGGPPGIIIGGAIGALIGEGWNAKERVGDLQASLYQSQLQIEQSQLELAALREEASAIEEEHQAIEEKYQIAQMELDRFRSEPPRILPAFLPTQAAVVCCNNTALSIHFRTGSNNIESHYEEQLESLAKLADQMTNATVEITGYADRNGDANQNLQLSRQRSDSVKQFFNAKGIRNSSITTVAYGETRPLQSTQSFESDFFDRRVIVRLRDTSQQMLTQTPDGQ